MTEVVHPSEATELEEQIRDALNSYYDFAYLQRHPLASLLVGDQVMTSQTRAKELRRILLEAIEELNPGNAIAVRAPERRAYAILMGLYVEAQTPAEIARSLSISERQLRRDRSAAIAALTSIVRDRYLVESSGSSGDTTLLRHESTRLAQVRELLDITEVVETLASLLQTLADERGFTLSVFSQPDIPSPRANRVLLRQALISFTTHLVTGLPVTQLTLEALYEEEDAIVAIRARCSRCETSDVELDHLTLESAETMVEALGGRVECRIGTESGVCVTIAVLLPVEREVTVLVVDDNESLFALFQRYTVGHPYQLVHASGVEEALAELEAYSPEIITVDLMMPNRDGWELLQHLKISTNVGPAAIVVCSVLAEPELAQLHGADLYLKKPVHQIDLLRTLNQARDLHRRKAAHPEHRECNGGV